jgi:hypothetical protein
MKILIQMLLLGTLFLFTACTSLPKPDEMKKDIVNFNLPKLPKDGQAIVYVVRSSAVGGMIRFNVFLDDKEAASEMGYNRGNQYIYFNVNAGDHQILSKAENWAELNFTAAAGDIIFIQQNPSMGLIMARNSLIKIQDYEGKYQVKHLSLGTIIKEDK